MSVGFIALKWEDGRPEDPWRRRYTAQELVEVSAVGIPANLNALALVLRSGPVNRRDLLDALDQLLGQRRPARAPGGVVASMPFIRCRRSVRVTDQRRLALNQAENLEPRAPSQVSAECARALAAQFVANCERSHALEATATTPAQRNALTASHGITSDCPRRQL